MAPDSTFPKQVACLVSEFFACVSFSLTSLGVSIRTVHQLPHSPHTHHPMAIPFSLGVDLVFLISTPGQPLPNNWRWLKRGESYSPQLLSLEGMDFVLFTSFLIHKQLY